MSYRIHLDFQIEKYGSLKQADQLLRSIIKIIFISYFVIISIIQFNDGIADNGDFFRIMTWFSSGPIDIEPKWPDPDTEAWSDRFINYVLPYWELDFPSGSSVYSSVVLIWLPGILLNCLFFSTKVLSLPILSITPSIIFLLSLLFLFQWIETSNLNEKRKTVTLAVAGGLFTILLTASNYTRFFSSFYQETAEFLFLTVILVILVFLVKGMTKQKVIVFLLVVLLLSAAKTSTIYWGVLLVPFIVYIGYKRGEKLQKTITLSVVLFIISCFGFLLVRSSSSVEVHAYNSMFFGVLTLSEEPITHLDRLGMSGFEYCIGESYYFEKGKACSLQINKELTHLDSLNVIVNEPKLIFRIFQYISENMQITSIDHLGRYPKGTPDNVGNASLANPWSALKESIFPINLALWLSLVAFILIFVFGLKKTGFTSEVSLLGLVVSFGFLVDSLVTFIGDGQGGILKHLIFSNFLYDISLILACILLFFYFQDFILFIKSKFSSKRLAKTK